MWGFGGGLGMYPKTLDWTNHTKECENNNKVEATFGKSGAPLQSVQNCDSYIRVPGRNYDRGGKGVLTDSQIREG